MFTRFLMLSLLIGLLAALVSCMAQSPAPVRAQARITPTPWPAISATATAAAQMQANAQSSANAAVELERQAAEMRRNAAAQQAAAQQAISDARAASAAQNGQVVGEAIGRAEAQLDQLSRTVTGQGDALNRAGEIINTLVVSNTNLTNEVESLRASLRDAKTVNDGLIANQAAQQGQRIAGYIVSAFVFIVIGSLLAWLLMHVLQRREQVTVISNEPIIHDGFTSEIDG